jgi:hypothetical protein
MQTWELKAEGDVRQAECCKLLGAFDGTALWLHGLSVPSPRVEDMRICGWPLVSASEGKGGFQEPLARTMGPDALAAGQCSLWFVLSQPIVTQSSSHLSPKPTSCLMPAFCHNLNTCALSGTDVRNWRLDRHRNPWHASSLLESFSHFVVFSQRFREKIGGIIA